MLEMGLNLNILQLLFLSILCLIMNKVFLFVLFVYDYVPLSAGQLDVNLIYIAIFQAAMIHS